MNLLLFGKDGQVGWELQRALAPLGRLTAMGSADVDFTRAQELAHAVRQARPDVIVNAAAYTAVDKAESEPDAAHAVNADAPGVLAEQAAALGAWLVHYGTDYVFDGSGNAPRDEQAALSPLSVYGRTKRDGEERVRASGCRHLILRTSWVYAARGHNFPRTILRLAAERERLSVVDDQVGAPTGADLLADVTAHALRAAIQDSALQGTYHVAAAGETTWHAYAGFVIDWARARGMALKVGEVQPVSTSAYPTAARRPLNSRLDTRRLQRAFDLVMPPWQAGVARMLDESFH
jgi:dTDP-4-dehydrorhamnose reductase